MTIKSLYPNVRPTLNLNFARTKALDPRITFTRASTATYVGADGLIKTAASGAARFDHNPATGESLGLLVEEARTNYFTNSSLPTGAVNGVKTTVSGYLLPDGTTGNCTQLYVNQVQANLYDGFGAGTIPVNTQFHFTFWVQNISGFPVTFTYGRASVVPVTIPNDGKWYKLSGDAGSSNGIGQLFNFFYVDTRPGSSTNPVSTPFTVLLWGSQMEAGTFPTSYIPTSGSTVTRAADVASMTGTNFSSWWNANKEGTLYFNHDLSPETQVASTTNSMIVAFADSLTTYTNVIGLWGSGSSRYLTTGSYNLNNEGYNLSDYAPSASFDKYALAYKVGTGTSRAAINGTLFANTRNTPSAYIPTGFYFGGTHTQRIARLAYYPVRLSDAQLQALTS
jgi:hypothetical protein